MTTRPEPICRSKCSCVHFTRKLECRRTHHRRRQTQYDCLCRVQFYWRFTSLGAWPRDNAPFHSTHSAKRHEASPLQYDSSDVYHDCWSEELHSGHASQGCKGADTASAHIHTRSHPCRNRASKPACTHGTRRRICSIIAHILYSPPPRKLVSGSRCHVQRRCLIGGMYGLRPRHGAHGQHASRHARRVPASVHSSAVAIISASRACRGT